MNKADRERVEEIRLRMKCNQPDGCICTVCFLVNVVDKQDKVVEAAKAKISWFDSLAKRILIQTTYEKTAKIHVDVFNMALKELEGEK